MSITDHVAIFLMGALDQPKAGKAKPNSPTYWGQFAFPPCHLDCASEAARAGRGDVVVSTGGFDLIRPTRRGGPVAFHPNSVIENTPVA